MYCCTCWRNFHEQIWWWHYGLVWLGQARWWEVLWQKLWLSKRMKSVEEAQEANFFVNAIKKDICQNVMSKCINMNTVRFTVDLFLFDIFPLLFIGNHSLFAKYLSYMRVVTLQSYSCLVVTVQTRIPERLEHFFKWFKSLIGHSAEPLFQSKININITNGIYKYCNISLNTCNKV